MKLLTPILLVGVFLFASGSRCFAEWSAETPIKDSGTSEWVPWSLSGCTHVWNEHFDGFAYALFNETYANQYGFPYLCSDRISFSTRAEGSGTLWKRKWVWECSDPPADESTMDITIKMTWDIHGDCNNQSWSKAYAKSYAHGQVVINSAPDNAGDYTGEGEWSGEKRETDTFSGGLSLDWDSGGPGGGVSLSWSPDPTDEWQSGPTTKTNRYLQNIKNHVGGVTYTYISAAIALLSEVETSGDTNANTASAIVKCRAHAFSLSEPN